MKLFKQSKSEYCSPKFSPSLFPSDALDFVSAVTEVVFQPVSEAVFTSPYTSCGTFEILEDKIAFEGEEGFTVRLLPPREGAGYVVGENSTADVVILDNDSK